MAMSLEPFFPFRPSYAKTDSVSWLTQLLKFQTFNCLKLLEIDLSCELRPIFVLLTVMDVSLFKFFCFLFKVPNVLCFRK